MRATGDIGLLVLTEEAGVAAGVRRVEALTGPAALAHLRAALDELQRACAAANITAPLLVAKIEQQAVQLSKAQKEIRELKTAAAMGGSGTGGDAADHLTVGRYTVVVRRVDQLDREGLRALADRTKSTLADGVVFLAGETTDGRVAMVAGVTPGAAKKAPAGGDREAPRPDRGRRRRRTAGFRRSRRQGRGEDPGTARVGTGPHRIAAPGLTNPRALHDILHGTCFQPGSPAGGCPTLGRL